VQSPGIKVADFLAVRPEHRGDDDGALVEPSNRSGHDSTNANEGSTPLVFGTGLDNFDGGLPSDLINERFFRSSSRKSPSAGFQKWPTA
jgi:hypothetical protein